jgi:predicted amidohydrolase
VEDTGKSRQRNEPPGLIAREKTMPKPTIVSAVQITAVDGEKDATVEKMMRYLDVAGGRGSELVVLPEVWTGLGYSTKTFHQQIAEPIPGPTTNRLAEKAKHYGMTIIG